MKHWTNTEYASLLTTELKFRHKILQVEHYKVCILCNSMRCLCVIIGDCIYFQKAVLEQSKVETKGIDLKPTKIASQQKTTKKSQQDLLKGAVKRKR